MTPGEARAYAACLLQALRLAEETRETVLEIARGLTDGVDEPDPLAPGQMIAFTSWHLASALLACEAERAAQDKTEPMPCAGCGGAESTCNCKCGYHFCGCPCHKLIARTDGEKT